MNCWTIFLAPPQDESARSYDVVLPTRDRGEVVIRRAGIEVTSLAAQRHESPHLNVKARPEIENAASKFARRLLGPAVDSRNALFVVGISAAHRRVRRNPR